jgi:hypothetical protein
MLSPVGAIGLERSFLAGVIAELAGLFQSLAALVADG